MAETSLRQGAVLDGRYLVGARIGSGTHGVIHHATDLGSGEPLAIKFLHRDVADHPEYAVRLWREAQALKALWGTSVIRIHRFGQDKSGAVYLAMELLEGETLEQHLADIESFGHRINALDTLTIFDPVACALEVAHAKGILHRDIKPANIFLVAPDRGGGVRLMDFGLTRFFASGNDGDARTSSASLTAAGTIAGSPAYIAPEVWRTERLDQRVDVYALAAVIFRALAGRPPFHAPTMYELFLRATSGARPKLTAARPDLVPDIDAWVARALAVDRDQRYPDVPSMWGDFVDLLLQGSSPSVSLAREWIGDG